MDSRAGSEVGERRVLTVLCASVLENRVPSTVSVADPSAVAAVTLELSTRAVRWLWYSKSHVWLPLHAAAMRRRRELAAATGAGSSHGDVKVANRNE
jgi:hypothetical protein